MGRWEEWTATYRVVTPMFCAGADPTTPEIRAASFKGVLRFWWRALAWGWYRGDLDKIRTEEERIFGGPGTGQSRVQILRLRTVRDPSLLRPPEVLRDPDKQNEAVVGEGARYLGYGLMEAFRSTKKGTQAGQLTRACFLPFELEVELVLRVGDGQDQSLTSRDKERVAAALKAMGLLGGLGARTRRGWGSLSLAELRGAGLEQWSAPQTAEELLAALKKLKGGGRQEGNSDYPKVTAFSQKTKISIVRATSGSTPLDLLDEIGKAMVRYRSLGQGGTVLGKEPSLRKFEEDHRLMLRPVEERDAHPRRIAFGLPHNYGKPASLQVTPRGYDRRASPLFIHIHGSSPPLGVLAFLPAEFLPNDDRCGRKVNVGGAEVDLIYETELFLPVEEFLKEFSKRDGVSKLPPAQEVEW